MVAESRRKGRPKSFHPNPDQTRIQALDRALDILEVVAAGHGMTLTEIAADLKQSPATVYRALATMEARQMVEADQLDQTWHIGPSSFRVGSAFLRRTSVVERSRPAMRVLMELTGETSNLGIERNGQVLFISQVETHESIRAFFPPGTQSPMHASGIGKALLSRFDDKQMDRFLNSEKLVGFTERTIRNAEDLRKELRVSRERGYAIDDQEKADGMRCVASPVLDFHGEAVAGISVSGPVSRMTDDRMAEIGEQVRRAAEDLSYRLGASG